jgi:hypothetical protein
VSPTLGPTAQTQSTPIRRRPINDGDSSTDEDKHVSIKLSGPIELDDADVEKRHCLLPGECKPFFERRSEGSNDECLPPNIAVQQEVRIIHTNSSAKNL